MDCCVREREREREREGEKRGAREHIQHGGHGILYSVSGFAQELDDLHIIKTYISPCIFSRRSCVVA
jgi:hypothetical protein